MLNANFKKVLGTALVGNTLEYYDFTVYAVFSISISNTFFPYMSPTIALMYSLCVFSIGFVARPVGGIIIGYIGDTYGRKVVLICSIIGMTTSTICIALIPGYDSWGSLSQVLLIIMRLLQGICISGEGAGSAIFVLEHYGLKSGFIGGMLNAFNIIGTLLAVLAGLLLSHIGSYAFIQNMGLDDDNLWRVAFLAGGLFGVFGLILRLQAPETPVYQAMKKDQNASDTVVKSGDSMILNQKSQNLGIIHYLKSKISQICYKIYQLKIPFILVLSTSGVASSYVYIIKAFINIYFTHHLGMSNTSSLCYVLYGSIVMIFLMPVFGYLGDKYGTLKIMLISSVASVTGTIPGFLLINSESYVIKVLGVTTLSACAASVSGNAYSLAVSLFKPNNRYFGVGFGYNLGTAIFGGTTPLISTYLITKTHLNYSPAFYIMFLITVFAILLLIHYTDDKYTI